MLTPYNRVAVVLYDTDSVELLPFGSFTPRRIGVVRGGRILITPTMVDIFITRLMRVSTIITRIPTRRSRLREQSWYQHPNGRLYWYEYSLPITPTRQLGLMGLRLIEFQRLSCSPTVRLPTPLRPKIGGNQAMTIDKVQGVAHITATACLPCQRLNT